MLDHIAIHTNQLDTLTHFYETVLAPLGYKKLASYEDVAGFGRDKPELWIGTAESKPTPIHIALVAPGTAAVDAFYRAALATGAKDNGPPGPRPDYSPDYYAAFVFDPDGNNLEAVCHQPV